MEQLTTNWVSRKVYSPDTGCRTIRPAQDQVKMTIFEHDKYRHQVHAEESKKRKNTEKREVFCADRKCTSVAECLRDAEEIGPHDGEEQDGRHKDDSPVFLSENGWSYCGQRNDTAGHRKGSK